MLHCVLPSEASEQVKGGVYPTFSRLQHPLDHFDNKVSPTQ